MQMYSVALECFCQLSLTVHFWSPAYDVFLLKGIIHLEIKLSLQVSPSLTVDVMLCWQGRSGSWPTSTMTVCTMIHHSVRSCVAVRKGCVIHRPAESPQVYTEITTVTLHGRLLFPLWMQCVRLNRVRTSFCGLGICVTIFLTRVSFFAKTHSCSTC